MKLIIDITEEHFKDCQLTLSSPFELVPLIESYCTMIVNGIPLEDIKTEIESLRDKQQGTYTAGLKLALEIIDNHTCFLDEHIKENKQ